MKVYTDTLRSRCRITSQKDTGSAYIDLLTIDGHFKPISILKQIVSLRETNEFHEPCCEKLFNDFIQFPGVTGVSVMLLYARRGSLDINPVRATGNLLPSSPASMLSLNSKTLGQ
jgi:7-cyano-7-deazaguanine reductase